MDKLYLTFGSKDYLLGLADRSNVSDIQFISKPGQSQFGIISREILVPNARPIELDIEQEYAKPIKGPELIGLFYFIGEDKQAEIAKKTLEIHRDELRRLGAHGSAIWAKEHKYLHRNVLLVQLDDAAAYEHFSHSKIMQGIAADFYSSFNVLYADGFDQD
ncbi:MAG: hypothetical protein ABF661_06915 [Oenococcus sp.]|uniref:hypothetical protein n=1 Tax=Oenococcus sp. TaxID=1979414 RepID=UPI0039EAF870